MGGCISNRYHPVPLAENIMKGHIYSGCKIVSFHHHIYTLYWNAICYNEIHHLVRHILGLLTVLQF